MSKKTTVVSLNHVLINPVVYSIEILNGYTIFTYINDIGAFNKNIKKVSDTVDVIKHTFCLYFCKNLWGVHASSPVCISLIKRKSSLFVW